ncbi:MAG: flagellar export protein FliJ [Proteobacteria bacterium]|nr:flagellar export protein FliJ [Pseudomonadota bacterium]MBU1710535.1 flagellar export protein FliJ [Pseudomonadota bacterium]
MGYTYKLEALLTFRRNLEEQSQQLLARELLLLENHKHKLQELKDARTQLIADFEERKKMTMTSYFFSFYMDGISNKEREVIRQERVIQAQAKVFELARLKLLEKVKSRKVIEKAREKDYSRYLKELLSKEQKEGDEAVLLRYGRKGHA